MRGLDHLGAGRQRMKPLYDRRALPRRHQVDLVQDEEIGRSELLPDPDPRVPFNRGQPDRLGVGHDDGAVQPEAGEVAALGDRPRIGDPAGLDDDVDRGAGAVADGAQGAGELRAERTAEAAIVEAEEVVFAALDVIVIEVDVTEVVHSEDQPAAGGGADQMPEQRGLARPEVARDDGDGDGGQAHRSISPTASMAARSERSSKGLRRQITASDRSRTAVTLASSWAVMNTVGGAWPRVHSFA